MGVVPSLVLPQNALAVNESRNFKRVPTHEPGLLEFSTKRARHRIPITIASAACQGLRLSRPQPIDDILEGARIDVHVQLGGEDIRLPGHVVWVVHTRDGNTSVGVELALAVAPEKTRQIWASWIVEETKRHSVAVRARGSANHKLVKISRGAIRRAKTNPPEG